MPIYEYQASGEQSCHFCASGFEIRQGLAEARLEQCPRCGARCRRIISAPSIQRGQSHLLEESNLAKHGFTQYRKVGKGEYERTAGDKGPSKLKSD